MRVPSTLALAASVAADAARRGGPPPQELPRVKAPTELRVVVGSAPDDVAVGGAEPWKLRDAWGQTHAQAKDASWKIERRNRRLRAVSADGQHATAWSDEPFALVADGASVASHVAPRRIAENLVCRHRHRGADGECDCPRGLPAPRGSAGDRSATASGRAATLTFDTDGGVVTMKGNDIRFALRDFGGEILNSTYFSLEPIVGSDGGLTQLTLRGRGNGHGVRMCQWGAIGRARGGMGFHEILLSYYPGATFAKLVDAP